MNITVHYEDGDSAIIPYNERTKIDFNFQTVSKVRMLMNEEMPILQMGNTSIEVRYRKEATTILTIEVKEKEVTEITVVNKPTKLEYQEGETFNPEGLKLEVSYNNGSKEEVEYNEETKDMFTYNENKLTVKDTKVVIEYGGKETEIDIKVMDISKTDKIPLQMINTKDDTRTEEYIMLVGISLVSMIMIVYRRKES